MYILRRIGSTYASSNSNGKKIADVKLSRQIPLSKANNKLIWLQHGRIRSQGYGSKRDYSGSPMPQIASLVRSYSTQVPHCVSRAIAYCFSQEITKSKVNPASLFFHILYFVMSASARSDLMFCKDNRCM